MFSRRKISGRTVGTSTALDLDGWLIPSLSVHYASADTWELPGFLVFSDAARNALCPRAPCGWIYFTTHVNMPGVRRPDALFTHNSELVNADRSEGVVSLLERSPLWLNIVSKHVAFVLLACTHSLYCDFRMWRHALFAV